MDRGRGQDITTLGPRGFFRGRDVGRRGRRATFCRPLSRRHTGPPPGPPALREPWEVKVPRGWSLLPEVPGPEAAGGPEAR